MFLRKIRQTSQYSKRYFSQPFKMQVKPTSFHLRKVENLQINKILPTKQKFSNEEWMKFRKELFEVPIHINEYNVDNIIVNLCVDYNNIEAAINYINFLKSNGMEVNVATTGTFFKGVSEIKTLSNPREQKIIYELYDQLRAKYEVLDAYTAVHCILGLCLTDRWRESNELLEMMESCNQRSSLAYSAIIASAFNHDDLETGFKTMKKMLERFPLDKSHYKDYLSYCSRHSKSPEDIENLINKLFQFWFENDVYPDLPTVQMIANYLQSHELWEISVGRITQDGLCSRCHESLADTEISQKAFEHMSNRFMEKVFVGQDVYCNTTPKELDRFKTYVERSKPFDVVLDGLNISFALKCRDKSNNDKKALRLAEVVKLFLNQNKKIFILGRKHMNSWSFREMQFIRDNTNLFLIDNLSNDDAFILYAALQSGKDTYICSRDFMRPYKYSLKDLESEQTFRRWQLTHQIQLLTKGDAIKISYPSKLIPTAIRSRNNNWHLPFAESTSDSSFLAAKTVFPSWLCIKKRKLKSQ